MAKRVKSLNARREELKAGIVTATAEEAPEPGPQDRDDRQDEGHPAGA